MRICRTLLVLGRVSNLPTVWTNCLVGMVLVTGTLEAMGTVVGWGAVMAGVSLLYVGGMFLNDFLDAGWDGEHAPERPIPAGAISRKAVLVWSVLLLGGGWVLLVRVGGAESLWAGVLVGAIVLYDVLHKHWVGSVLLMGLCRFAVYAVAGTAVWSGGGWVEMPVRLWVGAGALLFYVVGITLAARGERSGGTVKGVAWVCLWMPVGVWAWMGVTWTGGVVLAVCGWWMWVTTGHLRVKEDKRRLGGFVRGLLAGIVVVDALLVSGADARAAWICLAMLPVCRFLQRWIPAT